jgi:hypothetical protein
MPHFESSRRVVVVITDPFGCSARLSTRESRRLRATRVIKCMSSADPASKPAGEPVWTLVKHGKRVDCELRFHGESTAWSVSDCTTAN